LKLGVYPFLGLGLSGPRALAKDQGASGKGHGIQAHLHVKVS
jgi:hypothetical protein